MSCVFETKKGGGGRACGDDAGSVGRVRRCKNVGKMSRKNNAVHCLLVCHNRICFRQRRDGAAKATSLNTVPQRCSGLRRFLRFSAADVRRARG